MSTNPFVSLTAVKKGDAMPPANLIASEPSLWRPKRCGLPFEVGTSVCMEFVMVSESNALGCGEGKDAG
jgi:hypothetical protein